MAYKWQVSLKPHLSEEQRLESPYKIAKDLGMSKNTVIRYMESDEEMGVYLSSNVGALAKYFDVDIHKIIKLVEVFEDEKEGQEETLLATA